MCGRGGGGAPEPFSTACGGPWHPDVDLRTIQGPIREAPGASLLCFSQGWVVGTVGELLCLCPVAQPWGCSASPLAALLADGPTFWLGFEAPLTFAISSQCPCPPPPPKVSLRFPWPWGMQGYNSPLSGAALMGKFESFLREGE